MAISIDLNLSDLERAQLAGILGCEVSHLETELGSYGTAALEEYVRMFLGQRVFTRGSDMLEYRLLLLTKSAFGGRLPDEQRVSAVFQRSATGSRSLIRAVIAKYQYELSGEVATTMKDTLTSVNQDGDDWSFVVNSENVVETMNRVLAGIDGTLPQVGKKSGMVASYSLKSSSYHALCEYYGIAPKQGKKS